MWFTCFFYICVLLACHKIKGKEVGRKCCVFLTLVWFSLETQYLNSVALRNQQDHLHLGDSNKLSCSFNHLQVLTDLDSAMLPQLGPWASALTLTFIRTGISCKTDHNCIPSWVVIRFQLSCRGIAQCEEKLTISASWAKDEDISRLLQSLPNWANMAQPRQLRQKREDEEDFTRWALTYIYTYVLI